MEADARSTRGQELSDLDDLADGLTGVPRETVYRLKLFRELVIAESERQNLISASTVPVFWSRHIADSAQLFDLVDGSGQTVDIGSGAGLPGMVLAILGLSPIALVEPRRKRADFLLGTVRALGLESRVNVHASRVESVELRTASTITARAVGPLGRLFEIASHLANGSTRWILPKGRSAMEELEQARRTWHGRFELVPSITDPEATIIVATDVRRKGP